MAAEPGLDDLPLQTGEAVWDARLAAAPEQWLRAFAEDEIAALAQAADAVLEASASPAAALPASPTPAPPADLSLSAADAAAAALPAPLLARLRALRDDELLRGRGFAVLRGLPVAAWGDARAAAAFLVLSRALGALRQQNGAGHVLGHVTDLGLSSADPSVRVYQTHERQSFHTDSCDIVALLMLRPARRGGDSFLVSVGAVFNALRERSPRLLRALLRPLATDRRGEVPAGAQPFFTIPVLSLHESFLSVIYQRQYINSAQRFADAPRLDAETVAALDAFDKLCEEPSLQVAMRLEPGDVQLVHNHALLHDRSAFEDFEEHARRRHLLRAWIAPEPPAPVRPLPAAFAQRFGSVQPGRRGGVELAGVAPVARWTPPPRAR